MTVLVTGATGFLGSYLVADLVAAGHGVAAFDVAPPGAEALTVAPSLAHRLIQGPVSDTAQLATICRSAGVTAIVHAAALVGVENGLHDPAATYQTNVMGFVSVCEAARQAGVTRVVLVSSNAVYHAGSGESLSESDKVFSVERGNPAGHYGTSKLMQEAVALAYASSHGLDVIVVRVTAIYGFGMRAPLYIKPMVENAVRGVPTRIATGGPMKRDYTYVLDCAAAITRAVTAPRIEDGQRVFNVSAGHAVTATAVAAIVRQIVPGADIEIGETLSPLEAESARMRAPLDCTAARAVLGWSPRWPLADGTLDYVQRFRHFDASVRR